MIYLVSFDFLSFAMKRGNFLSFSSRFLSRYSFLISTSKASLPRATSSPTLFSITAFDRSTYLENSASALERSIPSFSTSIIADSISICFLTRTFFSFNGFRPSASDARITPRTTTRTIANPKVNPFDSLLSAIIMLF